MGFIREIIDTGKQSATGVLNSQWKEIIRCQDMGDNVLMMKKTSASGIIAKGSAIQVDPGQCAVIVDSGQVVDAVSEEGIYTFDASTAPSVFTGNLTESVKQVFLEMAQRFTFKGKAGKEQAIYYFNLREITGNGFGTKGSVPYKDWEHAIINARVPDGKMAMSVGIKCFGTYTFKIENPALFMREIAGTAPIYEKAPLLEQMHSEILAAFQSVLNRLGTDAYRIGAMDLPSKTFEIKQIMDTEIMDQSIRNRGLRIISFAVESVTMDDESKKKIQQWEISGDALSQQGILTQAYADAMKNAASNEGGAMNGILGVGMMTMASGGVFQQVPGQVAAQQSLQQVSPPAVTTSGKFCQHCGAAVTGNFCGSCGTKVQPLAPPSCPQCGTPATGKFCQNCGTQLG